MHECTCHLRTFRKYARGGAVPKRSSSASWTTSLPHVTLRCSPQQALEAGYDRPDESVNTIVRRQSHTVTSTHSNSGFKGKPVLDEYLTPTFVRAMGLQCSELANLDLVPLAKLTIVALSGMISGIKVQCLRALS